ncbi:S8 family peptidase [Chitinophaga filiformis]|uniref:Por secretion system C-terminal sorting domain-containing protein n=1 Tax=Chitinophaga filiformis TaxID=104663 RepID=A0A1G7X7V5_CHIFI|nr:S8 family peptidase [Chitinophaga filiformis]SDG80252.1 Por secretion system C-terminal sorting domain-containing protein [Chitinophaga filiformis]
MNARVPILFLFLLINLFIPYAVSAQQRTTTDSIVLRYADTTATPSGYFLVKFDAFPGSALLQKHGLTKTLSPRHHILQRALFDSVEAKHVMQIYPANYNWKCSDALVRDIGTLQLRDSLLVQVSFNNTVNTLQYCRPLSAASSYPVVIASVKMKDWALFTAQPNVRFVDRFRTARTEVAINNALPSVDYINVLHQQYPALQGNNHTVGIKEEWFDTTDIDLLGKAVPSPLAATTINPHATMMATLIAGLGNTGPSGKGVAVKARLSSSNYQRLLPDENNYFKNANIIVQNHSYGTTLENYYGAEAVAYDQQVYTLDTLLHIFSSGNIGNSAPADGIYKGLPGYANLSGTFKQAKNVLVIGGIDTGYNVPVLSSKGPAFDGRISPQLVAYGQAGTSDAAATTTGIATIVQEAFQQEFSSTPSSAMVKAIMVNSADDINTPGPDYSSGYGLLNAVAAVRTINDKRLSSGVVTTGNSVSIPVNVPPNTARLKITLCWNDPAATENISKSLLNDLDLSVTDNTGKSYLPWLLSTYPSADSLSAPARHGRDSINNVEQVSIELPATRTVNIQVSARQLSAGTTQRFHIAWQAIPLSSFEWQYPAAGEQLTAGDNIAIRWRTPHTGNGTLSFSADSGRSWTPIAVDIPLAGANSRWNIPAIFSKGLLRMSTTDTTWTSDYFNISTPININVGYNCPDTLQINWRPIDNASGYEVYTMQGKLLSLISTTTDTVLLISKAQLSSPYISVTPRHKDGWSGLQSATYNYEQQGVLCFFRQILADVLADNSVDVTVVLSTQYRVKKIYWERLQVNDFVVLSSQDISSSDQYIYKDHPSHSGIFYYRVKLELTDGRFIYSDVQSVQILINQEFHLFPVPASQQLTLLSSRLGDLQIRFVDMNGRTVFTRQLTQMRETYSLKGMAAGVYICVIYEGERKIFTKRFVKLTD